MSINALYLSQYLTNLMHKISFYSKFISCLYMFRAYVLIIRRSKLHYTASGIITLKQVSGLKLLKYSSVNIYYHLLIFTELYFSNFRPLTSFSVMIPEAV